MTATSDTPRTAEIMRLHKECMHALSTSANEYVLEAAVKLLELENAKLRSQLLMSTPVKVCCGKFNTYEEQCIPLVKHLRAELARVTAERDAALADARRLEFMSIQLCRRGEMQLSDRTVMCYAWAITSANPNLRDAIDAAMQERKE